LSNVVLADFMPLVPDRWLNVTRTSAPLVRRVAVYGPTYSDSSGHAEASRAPAMSVKHLDGSYSLKQAPDVAQRSVVEVWVERLDPALGDDFGWVRETEAVATPDSAAQKKAPSARARRITAAARERARDLVTARRFDEIARQGLIETFFLRPTLWSGTVTLPPPPDPETRYRLVIAEYEEYLVDDTEPYDRVPTKKDRRLVFVEHVQLG
jgi:hypothetical protein